MNGWTNLDRAKAESLSPPMKADGESYRDLALMVVLAIAAIALCVWLLSRDNNLCPDGWYARTTPTTIDCFNPQSNRPREGR